jgi:ribonucleoside-diphosphate reductase alpha chain
MSTLVAPKLSPLQEFIFYRTYSRWLDDKMRRETFHEVFGPVGEGRYLTYMHEKFGDKVPDRVWRLIEHRIYELGSMPSMRAAWTAGPALDANHIAGYNCAAIAFDSIFSVVELFYILMCGTGVGFSVESEYISKMPVAKRPSGYVIGTHEVKDSKEGWADALRLGMVTWFEGNDLNFDFSKVRPAGARLKTMGGRASGPEPLRRLLSFTKDIITKAHGRKLTSVEWLDIGNMIGEVVVVGGVRRSSEISFSDLDDTGMRDAKVWPFPQHRHMSNNSVCYKSKPSMVDFMKEWSALAASGTGERGIFNLEAAMKASPRRAKALRDAGLEHLLQHLRTNPCGEINLIALLGQFCNLTEVVVRATDTFDDLCEKVKAAVWMGAMQATLTDFPYLRPSWKETCDRERLLGVSLTGQMDAPKLMTAEKLAILKDYAIKVCRKACKSLGINMSVAITTGKPSGTVSQLVNCASGAHPRFARWYIRRVRIDAKDPLFRMMRAQGVKFTPENGQRPEDVERKRMKLVDEGHTEEAAKILVPDWSEDQVMMWVVAFPEAAPKGCITRHEVSALDQLEWYLKLKKNWCEHNQSITVYVRDEEWLKVGAWVYDNWDDISGISFLPYDGGHYEQAPYEEIDEATYKAMVKDFPTIDYNQLSQFEQEDNTTGSKSYACSGDKCELV